jgi:hypothetical protein
MSSESRFRAWQIDDADFYELDSRDAQLEFLLQYAVLAPSSHNAQPWRFRIVPEGVEVRADLTRRLPIVDPADREMWMSVGAAIANLRVAAAHFGFATTVVTTADTIAIAFRETCAPDEDLRALFPAIKRRHTNRKPYTDDPLEPEALRKICDYIDRHPDTLRLLLPRDKGRIADLIAAAEREQMSQPAYRDELANWIRANDDSDPDGMCADGLGIATPFSAAAEWFVRNVDIGPLQAVHDRQLVEDAAMLVVVAAEDDRVSLVNAGEILERLLLRVTLEGLNYSFFNSPIQLDTQRDRIWAYVSTRRPPQLLLRVGRARSDVRAMPRRTVEDVIGRNE